MSFVNLMGNDVWSEADIVNRTEAMIRSEFPYAAVAILNRKATGAALGQYTMTDDEQAELARYMQVCEAARQAGNAARADIALLQGALDVEAAQRRLLLPPHAGPALLEDGAPNPQVEADAAQRAAAQAVIDGATQDVLDLVAARAAPADGQP